MKGDTLGHCKVTKIRWGTIDIIVVPKTWQIDILRRVHGRMGHLGHRKLILILKNSPYHPGSREAACYSGGYVH